MPSGFWIENMWPRSHGLGKSLDSGKPRMWGSQGHTELRRHTEVLFAGVWDTGAAQSMGLVATLLRVSPWLQHLISWTFNEGLCTCPALPHVQHKVPFITRCDLWLVPPCSFLTPAAVTWDRGFSSSVISHRHQCKQSTPWSSLEWNAFLSRLCGR